MRRFLGREKRYLDVLCGTGGWVIFLHDEGYRAEGMDPSRRVAQAISEYEPEISVTVAAPVRLPYPDASLDGIVAIGSLEGLHGNVLTALSEWRRVLKCDGTLFLEVPYANLLRRLVYLPLKRLEHLLKRSAGREPIFVAYLFTPAELARLVRQAGFAIVELMPHELPDSDAHFALYHDWSFLRARPAEFQRSEATPANRAARSGAGPRYQLNVLGQGVKRLCEAISPWFASSGLFAVAKALPPREKLQEPRKGRDAWATSRRLL